MASNKKKAAAAPEKAAASADPVEPASPPQPDLRAERDFLRERIASDSERLAEVERALAFREYPKMVKDRVFKTRAEHEAAGAEYAE